MQILAISGSLRAASTNTTLLKAAAALVPQDVTLNVYDGIGDLPHFNPDLDTDPPRAAVGELRFQLRKSAGVIISSPEYAHGVPGVLKNALDWLVASGELYEKPVALFSASPRANYAQASLLETLTVMTAKVVSGLAWCCRFWAKTSMKTESSLRRIFPERFAPHSSLSRTQRATASDNKSAKLFEIEKTLNSES